MMDTYNLAESSSARIIARARQIVVAATILLAVTLAGPPRLWGQQCSQNPSYVGGSVTISPGTLIGGGADHVTPAGVDS